MRSTAAQREVRLTPGKRVLFLTRDPELIRRQLRGELDLAMRDLKVEDLLDDINTDVMTPVWTGFDHDPAEIARNAYAGLLDGDAPLFARDALRNGNFEVIVSGQRKGTGSSRESAVQAEKWSGIRIAIAASFAPIYARNCINHGLLLGDHGLLEQLQAGAAVPFEAFTANRGPMDAAILAEGGLFPFVKALAAGRARVPAVPRRPARPQTMAEKILARHLVGLPDDTPIAPGDAIMVKVDAGYSYEFSSPQVHHFLSAEYGAEYRLPDPSKFAVFEDHMVFADREPRLAKFVPKIHASRELQHAFRRHSGVRDYTAVDGISRGICHQVAREQFVDPGDFVQATDSHTCMGGGNNALAWGVGTTEYAALLGSGMTPVTVPESVRFELHGRLAPNVTAKDVMLHILARYAKREVTLNRVIEYGGPGLAALSMDERATLANMATECSARSGICEADEALIDWIAAQRPGVDRQALQTRIVSPDPGAEYAGGVHRIDLGAIGPMVAAPGDPTNGRDVAGLDAVRIDIAYGGSCTAGKRDDLDMYARVVQDAANAGRRVAPGVGFFVQCGSLDVYEYARSQGYHTLLEQAGAQLIPPGCGACIGCGPGTSERADQVTVSAINRNFKGRSGPGALWLASPLTVAASAIEGKIAAWHEGMWRS